MSPKPKGKGSDPSRSKTKASREAAPRRDGFGGGGSTSKQQRTSGAPSRSEAEASREGASRRGRGSGDRADERSASRTYEQFGGEQVEGFHAVRELLRARRRNVREVWVIERAAGAAEIEELAQSIGIRVRRIGPARLEELARTEAPQGVIARAQAITPANVDELLRDPAAFIVALDGVTDPGNLGAVLRTAETAGVTGVVIPKHRAAGLGPTVLKAAAGAVEYLPIAFVAGIPAFLDQARRAGVWTVGLDADGTTSVSEIAVADGPVVLVLGSEGSGLARLTRDRCDVVASIPLHGRLESLNVSAAAAIALHAVALRREGGHGDIDPFR